MNGYAEIAAHYRRAIRNGELNPGDQMPSYSEAVERHGVNRTTIVRAYGLLKSEGLIASKPGVGTVVTDRPRVAPATGAARADRVLRGGPNYEHNERSVNHTVQMLSCADPGIARHLEIEPHDEVVVRRRLFVKGDKPVSLGLSFIKPRALINVPELMDQTPMQRFWHEMYEERTGRRLYRSPEMRAARHASRDELEALGVNAPDADIAVPVLVKQVVWHDEEGPIEVWEDVLAPGLWDVEPVKAEPDTQEG